jgi:hypothetical protein
VSIVKSAQREGLGDWKAHAKVSERRWESKALRRRLASFLFFRPDVPLNLSLPPPCRPTASSTPTPPAPAPPPWSPLPSTCGGPGPPARASSPATRRRTSGGVQRRRRRPRQKARPHRPIPPSPPAAPQSPTTMPPRTRPSP